jgi:hypothetical protein
MKNNIIFGVFALIIVVLIGFAYIHFTKEPLQVACPADAQICSDGSSVGRTGPSCTFAPCPEVTENKYQDETIIIDAPELNNVVTSPVQITGQAKGTYFYEGSFPIMITDSNDQIIGEGTATAEGDWTTESFVPFAATITYVLPQGSTSKEGRLVLQNDNPSGIPENAIRRVVPIIFGEVE